MTRELEEEDESRDAEKIVTDNLNDQGTFTGTNPVNVSLLRSLAARNGKNENESTHDTVRRIDPSDLREYRVVRHYTFMEDGKIALVRLDVHPFHSSRSSRSKKKEIGRIMPYKPNLDDYPQSVVMFISIARYRPPLNPREAVQLHERLTTLDHVQLIRRLPSRMEIERHQAKFESMMIIPEMARTIQQLSSLTDSLRKASIAARHETLVIGFFVAVAVSVVLTGDPLIDHARLQQAHQAFLISRQRMRRTCDAFHVKIVPLKKKDILRLWFWNDAAPKHHIIVRGSPALLERYLRPVKVPTRLMAVDLPLQDHVPVGYHVGRSHHDSQVSRGFAPSPRVGPVILVAGGILTMRIGVLQRLVIELAKDHDHVIVLDLNHEFSALPRVLDASTSTASTTTSPHALNLSQFRILRLGTNFFMNPCHVVVPSDIKQDEERTQYRADFIARMIIAATRPWRGLEWKESLAMALKNFLNDEQETKGHEEIITFDDVHRMLEDLSRVGDVYVDVTKLEAVRHVIARLATIDALNNRFFENEHAPRLTDGKVILFQPDTHHSLDVKRLSAYYLLHFFAQAAIQVKSTKKIAVVIHPANWLFITAADRRSTAALTQLQRDAIMPFFDELVNNGVTMVLADASYTIFPSVFAAASDAIFLRAHDAVDASAIVKRMGLHVHSRLRERFLRPEDLILQLMDDEAFLMRQDLTLPQYVVLDPALPVNTRSLPLEKIAPEHAVPPDAMGSKSRGISLARFTPMVYAALMTVLEHLMMRPYVPRMVLLNVLKSRYPGIDEITMLKDIQKLPFVLITHRGGMETYQVTNKGREFWQSQQALLESLPPPYDNVEFNTIAVRVAEWMRQRDETFLTARISPSELLKIYQRLIRTLILMGDVPWYHVHHCFRWTTLLHDTGTKRPHGMMNAGMTSPQQGTRRLEARRDLVEILLRHCDEVVAMLSVAMKDPTRKQRVITYLTNNQHPARHSKQLASQPITVSFNAPPPGTAPLTHLNVPSSTTRSEKTSENLASSTQLHHHDVQDVKNAGMEEEHVEDEDAIWEWLEDTPTIHFAPKNNESSARLSTSPHDSTTREMIDKESNNDDESILTRLITRDAQDKKSLLPTDPNVPPNQERLEEDADKEAKIAVSSEVNVDEEARWFLTWDEEDDDDDIDDDIDQE